VSNNGSTELIRATSENFVLSFSVPNAVKNRNYWVVCASNIYKTVIAIVVEISV
jgi:hypothetical protein